MLSEAALALEAEVQARPDNAEAWRLLGTVHAENDDDQQVGRLWSGLGGGVKDFGRLLGHVEDGVDQQGRFPGRWGAKGRDA